MEKISITAADGFRLSALFSAPSDESRGMIVISPAAGIRKEFYINFTHFLNQQNYSVLVFDYRGIGGSIMENIKTSKIHIHEWGTKDMDAVIHYLVNEKKSTNIIWLGHSMGAQLIGFAQNSEYIRKVIAINAAFGYWKYFPAPMKYVIWFLWYIIGPLMIKLYGYGNMQLIGWGENLPKNALMEWREWCLNKNYFEPSIQRIQNTSRFHQFTIPITAVFTSDDFIANDKTVPLMRQFFPNAPYKILKLSVNQYTNQKVGHTGLFRKKFSRSLWPVLLRIIEGSDFISPERQPYLPNLLKQEQTVNLNNNSDLLFTNFF